MSTAPGHGEDLVDVLVHDHREIEELFAELETRDTGPERRRMTNAVVADLVRHSVAEEQYLYPVVRKALPEGDRIAEHEMRDHADAERDMKKLEGLDAATDPDFEVVLGKLMAEMRQHFLEEEVDLFPRLRAAVEPDELRELARKAQLIKKIAPTRPHPSAPESPAVSRLFVPALGLVDRIRDALRKP